MQIIGFNFTKIFAEKSTKVTKPPITNIEFIDFQKDTIDFLKESDTAKITFKYDLSYDGEDKKESTKEDSKKEGNIIFNGEIALSVTGDELKDITKSWKKQQLPEKIKIPLFNLILRRCTPKAVSLQDELSLPFHVPMPRVSANATIKKQ